jgi:hypothetical protein
MGSGVTRSEVLGAEDLEIIRGDVQAGRIAAAELVGKIPAHLAAARRGAREDADRRERIGELIKRAVRVTFEVPESAGGEG